MNSSVSMRSTTSESDAMLTASFNPRLCHDCQYLNNPSTTASHIGGYGSSGPSADLEALSQNLACIVCQAISKAVQTIPNSSRVSKHLAASRILVRNNGPSFLDDQYHSTPEKRIDTRDPTRLFIRAIMNISIIVPSGVASALASESELSSIEGLSVPRELDMLVPHNTEPDLDKLEEFYVTPQYCLEYSPEDRPELVRIEPWEVAYFDFSLLRGWVRDCEIFHGYPCNSFTASDTQTCKHSLSSSIVSCEASHKHHTAH